MLKLSAPSCFPGKVPPPVSVSTHVRHTLRSLEDSGAWPTSSKWCPQMQETSGRSRDRPVPADCFPTAARPSLRLSPCHKIIIAVPHGYSARQRGAPSGFPTPAPPPYAFVLGGRFFSSGHRNLGPYCFAERKKRSSCPRPYPVVLSASRCANNCDLAAEHTPYRFFSRLARGRGGVCLAPTGVRGV